MWRQIHIKNMHIKKQRIQSLDAFPCVECQPDLIKREEKPLHDNKIYELSRWSD